MNYKLKTLISKPAKSKEALGNAVIKEGLNTVRKKLTRQE